MNFSSISASRLILGAAGVGAVGALGFGAYKIATAGTDHDVSSGQSIDAITAKLFSHEDHDGDGVVLLRDHVRNRAMMERADQTFGNNDARASQSELRKLVASYDSAWTWEQRPDFHFGINSPAKTTPREHAANGLIDAHAQGSIIPEWDNFQRENLRDSGERPGPR